MPGSRSTLRDDILNVALALLTSEGPTAVSIRRIARELGVSPGAAYHHFDGKGALYRALVADGLAAMEQAVLSANDDAAPPLDRLVATARAYATFGIERPDHYYVMMMLRADGIPELSDADKAPGMRVLALTAEAIEAGMADGTIRPLDNSAAAAALLLWTTLHGIVALAASNRLEMTMPGMDAHALVEPAIAQTVALLRA